MSVIGLMMCVRLGAIDFVHIRLNFVSFPPALSSSLMYSQYYMPHVGLLLDVHCYSNNSRLW